MVKIPRWEDYPQTVPLKGGRWVANPFSNMEELALPLVDEAGIAYQTVEAFYQAQKFPDWAIRRRIALAATPELAKKIGRLAPNPIPDWNAVKLGVMAHALIGKFSQEPFRSRLLAAEPSELVEWNNWGDTFWGVVIPIRPIPPSPSESVRVYSSLPNLPTLAEVTGPGKGHNHLGRLLSLVRDELRGPFPNSYGDEPR